MTESATRSVVVEREFPHPPEKLWRALTQPPLIEEWLAKNDFAPAVGHRFQLRSTPSPHWNGITDCEVLVFEPLQRLVYSWNASGEEAATGPRTVVTFTLTPTKTGTICAWSSRASGPSTKITTAAPALAGRNSSLHSNVSSRGSHDREACSSSRS
jgi:uncharacterized protein YndB with AHSA1/START domain